MSQVEMRDIPGYEGKYAVTADGQIWSYYYNCFRSPWINKHGYLSIDLYKNGKYKKCRVNRLVAEAWELPKPDWWTPGIKLDVAHLDDNKMNNKLENLQWQTRSQNIDTDHWRETNKQRLRTPVRCVETGEEYPSQAAAARAIGLHPYGINNCLQGKQSTCGGYHWERVLDKENEK